MEVILIKQLKKLGRVGDIVKVAGGYGRNFLLPQKIAIRATDENLKMLESTKKEMEQLDKKAKQEKQTLAKKIDGKEIGFVMQSSEDGRLFGSITKKLLARKVSEHAGAEITHDSVVLSEPIKTLSIQEITLDLHPEVSCVVKVAVGRTQEEIADLISGKSKFCIQEGAPQGEDAQEETNNSELPEKTEEKKTNS